jgi:hypothetical protein
MGFTSGPVFYMATQLLAQIIAKVPPEERLFRAFLVGYRLGVGTDEHQSIKNSEEMLRMWEASSHTSSESSTSYPTPEESNG